MYITGPWMTIQPKYKRGEKFLRHLVQKLVWAYYGSMPKHKNVQLSCKAFLFAFGDITAHSLKFRLFEILAT